MAEPKARPWDTAVTSGEVTIEKAEPKRPDL